MRIFNKWWWHNNRPRPFKRIKWSSQRIERGFSDRDWWSFDQYLAGVIADGCHKFRYDGMGWPGEMSQDEWFQLLSKIENGFRQYQTILDVLDVDEEKRIIEEMKEAGELLIKWLPAFWD